MNSLLRFLALAAESEVVPAAQRFLRFAQSARRVKGSTRWAARMKATMMTHADAEQHGLHDVGPCPWVIGSRATGGKRIASAQPPANAAPNTSAPIRIAARDDGDDARPDDLAGGSGRGLACSWSVLFAGRNLSEKAAAYKRKRPKNAASRDIESPVNLRRKTGFAMSETLHATAPSEPADNPLLEGLADAVRDPAVRRDRARAFPAGLRAGLCRPLGRGRRHHPRSRGAGLRQHHHGAGALRQAAHQGLGGVLRPGLGALQSGDPGDRQGGLACGWRGTGIRS